MKYRRLSDYKIKKIMECFCNDLTASTTAKILSINRNTINAYFKEFRIKILESLNLTRVTLENEEYVEKEGKEQLVKLLFLVY